MNRYLTGHLPLISIFFFSLSFALYGQRFALDWLERNGILTGMADILSINEVRIGLIIVLLLVFFMIFAALKLIADTVTSLALLFFSKQEDDDLWTKTQGGQWIYFAGSIAALVLNPFVIVLLLLFVASSFAYILFIVYRIAESLTIPGLIGFIFLQLFFWSTFLFTIIFVLFRLYNTFIASLPL
ncbi:MULTISPECIES: DUF5366 family protein [Shouchella]|uniref:DUF5366 family protein n=2 Tax=Shouchella TaxID=2893057 RepID=A0ABY7W3Z6_9BACI|nr:MULTISPECIES: DUF5366 family protein [Shouchella]MED4129526.1 DUF5366 family protein [Shouchella miscanthi]WDF02791.1 DUF5366 family protein [Shouchella hunanensis]GAF22323.1 membrane protein [Bacillus sp. JCM 19047]